MLLAPDEGRVFKITHPDRYGKAYPRIDGQAIYRDATPLEYLVRLILCNDALGDDLWLEQILLDESNAVRILTSQPIISGVHPSEEDLHRHLFESGFEPLEAVDGVPMTNDWYRQEDQILMFDAHNGNFIETPEHIIVPIDIYVERVA